MVARNACARKRPRPKKLPRAKKRLVDSRKNEGSARMCLGECALLGAAGRARTPHVVQFRSVWVECLEEELAEKAF